jgi:hypothetical protein
MGSLTTEELYRGEEKKNSFTTKAQKSKMGVNLFLIPSLRLLRLRGVNSFPLRETPPWLINSMRSCT